MGKIEPSSVRSENVNKLKLNTEESYFLVNLLLLVDICDFRYASFVYNSTIQIIYIYIYIKNPLF